MASINSTAVTDPNVKFAATFLNTDYASKAVKDEVLMDKSTGEVVFKRPIDGRFLYYDRERFDTNEYFFQLQTLLNSSTFWLPTVGDDYYDKTYLSMIQYNLNEFEFDSTYLPNYEEGGKKRNMNGDAFSISRQSAGFFVKITTRPRDEALLNFVTAKYDNYYKNYIGEDVDILKETQKFSNSAYENSNIEIRYRITWVKGSNEPFEAEYSGYAKANQLSFIEFPKYTPPSKSDVDTVKLQIIAVSLPKFQLGKSIIRDSIGNKMLEKITDSQEIRLLSCNITTTITESSTAFVMPDQNCCTILLLDSMQNVDRLLDMFGDIGGGGGSILLSVPYPSEAQWRNMKLWMERIREVDSGGEITNMDSQTTFDSLESYFGKPLPTESTLTTNSFDINGFYVESIRDKELSLSW